MSKLNVQSKAGQKGLQAQALTKKHMLELFEGKKSKAAKRYIQQLKGSNSKAQKYIKQVLEEVFCQKKVTTATAYLYALIFYKNLLLSAQMDYYQDPQYFPKQIHEAIASICEYNTRQQNIKKKGTDYFTKAVIISKTQNMSNDEENLQAIGVSLVVFAMQIVQSMAKWYTEDYFTGEQSWFLNKYNQIKKKGITFPKQQQYSYIKQQDKNQFEQNYIQILQNQIQQDGEGLKPTDEGKVQVQPNQSKIQAIVRDKQPQKDNKISKEVKIAKLQSQPKVEKQSDNNIGLPVTKYQNASVKQSQMLRVQQQKDMKNSNLATNSELKPKQIKSPQKDRNKSQINSSQRGQTIVIQQNVKQIAQQKNKQQKMPNSQNKQNKSQILNLIRQKAPIIQKPKTIQKAKTIQKVTTIQKISTIQKATTFKSVVQPNRQLSSQKKQQRKQQPIKPKKRIFKNQQRQTQKHSKHNIFASSDKPSIHVHEPVNIIFDKIQQTHQKDKLNDLSQNVSFSPKFIAQQRENKYKQIRKRSLPKTQKKFIQKVFLQNSKMDQSLRQNIFQNTKINMQSKFPMKTLSSWRSQIQHLKFIQPSNKPTYQNLSNLLRNLRLVQTTLPFVPEYFSPVTLKMYGLRRCAKQISQFTQTSQVFFNNNVIQARLLKTSKSEYVLSLLNVQKVPLQLSVVDMSGTKYSNQIQVYGSTFTPQRKTTLSPGCYLDIKFVFRTADLNFKFLPFLLQINQRILPLELPITLLDQCRVQKQICIKQICNLHKNKGRIMKSAPFKVNLQQIPSFMRKVQPEKYQYDRSRQYNYPSSEQFHLGIFTLKMKPQWAKSQSILSCFISLSNQTLKNYHLNMIFDPKQEQTQNVAKVFMELLIFLLSQ